MTDVRIAAQAAAESSRNSKRTLGAGTAQTRHIPPQPQVNGSSPYVSVTVGGQSRTRKRSGGASTLKPAIYVHGRWYVIDFVPFQM